MDEEVKLEEEAARFEREREERERRDEEKTRRNREKREKMKARKKNKGGGGGGGGVDAQKKNGALPNNKPSGKGVKGPRVNIARREDEKDGSSGGVGDKKEKAVAQGEPDKGTTAEETQGIIIAED